MNERIKIASKYSTLASRKTKTKRNVEQEYKKWFQKLRKIRLTRKLQGNTFP